MVRNYSILVYYIILMCVNKRSKTKLPLEVYIVLLNSLKFPWHELYMQEGPSHIDKGFRPTSNITF